MSGKLEYIDLSLSGWGQWHPFCNHSLHIWCCDDRFLHECFDSWSPDLCVHQRREDNLHSSSNAAVQVADRCDCPGTHLYESKYLIGDDNQCARWTKTIYSKFSLLRVLWELLVHWLSTERRSTKWKENTHSSGKYRVYRRLCRSCSCTFPTSSVLLFPISTYLQGELGVYACSWLRASRWEITLDVIRDDTNESLLAFHHFYATTAFEWYCLYSRSIARFLVNFRPGTRWSSFL